MMIASRSSHFMSANIWCVHHMKYLLIQNWLRMQHACCDNQPISFLYSLPVLGMGERDTTGGICSLLFTPSPLYLVPRAGGEVLRWWVTTTCDNKTPRVITVLMSVSTRVSYCYFEKCRSQMTRYFFNTLERFKVCCRRPSSLSSSVLPYLLSSHVSSLVLFYIAAF